MKNYIVRKSWIDETTELARCSDYDLSVSICKPGYSVFDEEGTVMHSSYSSNRFKHGDEWNDLKKEIEADLIRLDMRRFPIITRKELRSIIRALFLILKLMNQVEVEDDRNE